VPTGALSAAKGVPDNPQDEQHYGNDPQDMQGEPSAKENKHKQQSQKQNHGTPHVSVEQREYYPRPACLTRYLPFRRLRPPLE
jgi:hypothetical protein